MYRRRRALCWTLGLAAVAALIVCAFGQPTQPSTSIRQVRFSKPSGFYDEPSGPILVQDASPNVNVYSNIADVSVYMDQALLEKNNATKMHDYQPPEQPVDKITVVRAVSIDPKGNRSQINDAVYFVGFGTKSGYEGLNMMSVVTDPSNLFDPEKGIYVTGNLFAESVVDGIVQKKNSKPFTWNANYVQRGKDWERPATIHCFDPSGSPLFSGQYGIRIQGQANRANLPKNLSIFAREEYGASAIDTAGLFDTRYSLDRMVLYYGSNDLMLADYLVETLTEGMDITDREMAPCAMFLDGEYWGVYWFAPKFKAIYLGQKYDVDYRNIIAFKHGHLEVGRDEDETAYEDMVEYIADHDMSVPANYAHACELVDMQSCIDYFATEIYVGNTDWPINNIALWRTRYSEDSDYGNCRWRWMIYDLEQGMDLQWVRADTRKKAVNLDPMFAGLMKNETFSAALRAKLMALASDTFEPDRVSAFVEDYKQWMAGPIEKKYRRFSHETKTIEDFYEGCDSIETFFRERREYIMEKYGGET